MHNRKLKSISVVKGSNWIYLGALLLTAASSAAADSTAELSEQYPNVQSIPSIDAFEVHRLENTDTVTDDTSSNDKYRTLKTSIAAFLITIGGLGILGWIYIAALRIKYNKQLKREEKMKKQMEMNASNANPYLDDEEQNNGCGNCCNSQPLHDGSIAPFPIPIYPKDDDGHNSPNSFNRNIHETSFDGQFGITSQSPRHITSSGTTHFIPEDDVDSFARALRNAAIQDDLHWNEIQAKKQRMLDHQQETHQVFRQQQPQDPTQQYDTSPRMKYMPQAFQTWNNGEYGDPGDVWLTSHSASTTGHSESETTSMSSYAGKNSSVEEGEHNEDVFKVMKNDRFNDMSTQHLLNPLRREEDESSPNEEESFCQSMSIASGTSTSLGIPSVSASAIDRDPVTHGFFVINKENDLMDQYIPPDEYEAAVQAAVMTLKNSPNSNKGRMSDSRFDDEPLLRSSDDGTPQHLQPYKFRKSPHFVPSDEDNESPHRRVRSPSNKTTNSILNESIESSTTGGGTGISTTESYESDPRKNKAIFHELKNVSVFLKNYEKKKSLKKKKNVGKFKLMNQGRAGAIPESDEQFDGLSVDTSTYDGSNLAPMSLASLATTKSEGETSGGTSSKRKGLYAFGRKKKGYVSEQEVKSMEVKIKPKKKKSRSSKRSALPPRHGNSTPRSEALSLRNTFPAIGASPSGESAASERRFLTTEIESFFAQQGKGVYESIEVSPKSNINSSPVVSRDEDINQSRSGSFDGDITDLMNDENRASLAVNTRLGAAPFNPKESSPNMTGHFVEKFSSPRWKKMDTDGVTKSLWHEDSIERKQPSPSIAHISSPNNIRYSSPSYIRNSSPSKSSSNLKNDVSSSLGQSPTKLAPSPKNKIDTNVGTSSPNSNRNPSPIHQSPTPYSKFSFEDKTLEDLPAPASIREKALRAKKDRELMGFPKPKNMNPSPPPPPPPPSSPPQHSPLAQSAKKILETGAKSFASIVERTRNQSPKNVVTGSTFPSSPSRLAPSHKDTTPIYVQQEPFQDKSATNFESKIQSSARSLMAMFENKSVDGNKSTDGTSLSSENKISDRISNRLNQIRQSVKERTTGSGMNGVPAVVVEQKVERKQPTKDNAWITHDESNTNVPFHDTVLSTTMKNNSTASSSSTSNMLPNKIASLHSALKSSNEELSPNKRQRNPGKLLKQPLSSHGISKSPFSNQTSGQVSGDSPSKESAIERQTRGSSNNTSSYGFQHNHNRTNFDSKVRKFNKRNDDDKDDTTPESPTRRGNTRNIISMFESKKTNNGIFPQSEHWQHSGTLRTKQQPK